MDYEQALAHLGSLHSFGVRPGLERMQALLARLGHPEQAECRFIHIAGTNGKGSVAAMIDSTLRLAGRRVGLFTSPHLHDHCERYRLNGENMPHAEFARLFARVWQAIEDELAAGGDSPTEFEAVTALALLWFAEQGVQDVVLECGLGGRLDSTNVVQPALVFITSVGLDHMDYLGPTVADIAREKAGILRPGVPLVCTALGEAQQVILARAEELGCPFYGLERDFFPALQQDGESELALFYVRTYHQRYPELRLTLAGAHQRDNAAGAVQALELLGCDEEQIRAGLAAARWPGRMEIVSREPLILLDGAHNEPGMAALARTLRDCWPGRRICALIGMLADKQREQALAHLLPLLSRAVVTPPPLAERAGDWQRVAELCQSAGLPTQATADNAEALDLARAALDADCDMLLVCGSLYLLADIRALLVRP